MPYRLSCAAAAVSALLASGCSSNEPTNPAPATTTASEATEPPTVPSRAPSTAPSKEADAPLPTLDPDACVDVTAANLDLAVANNSEDAQRPADVFARFNPPASVQEAIDHFVETGGVQYDDPDYDEYNGRIDAWVRAVCP
jgi:hypothetical protein